MTQFSKPIYAWKSGGFEPPVEAQVVGETLEVIAKKHGGGYRPEHVVAFAKPKASPLHPCFEWSDKKAAQSYRPARHGRLWLVQAWQAGYGLVGWGWFGPGAVRYGMVRQSRLGSAW